MIEQETDEAALSLLALCLPFLCLAGAQAHENARVFREPISMLGGGQLNLAIMVSE